VNKFYKNLEATPNFEVLGGCHEAISYSGIMNIRRHHTKCSCHGDLAPGIYARLMIVFFLSILKAQGLKSENLCKYEVQAQRVEQGKYLDTSTCIKIIIFIPFLY
jgi:hypothetical protein